MENLHFWYPAIYDTGILFVSIYFKYEFFAKHQDQLPKTHQKCFSALFFKARRFRKRLICISTRALEFYGSLNDHCLKKCNYHSLKKWSKKPVTRSRYIIFSATAQAPALCTYFSSANPDLMRTTFWHPWICPY